MERAVDIVTRVGRDILETSHGLDLALQRPREYRRHIKSQSMTLKRVISAKVADHLPPSNQPSSYLQPQQNNTTHKIRDAPPSAELAHTPTITTNTWLPHRSRPENSVRSERLRKQQLESFFETYVSYRTCTYLTNL